MSTFNERVTAMVNRYLSQANGSTASERVERAFRAIQADRQMRCLNDSVTVAAEHYLFTRYLTSSNLLVGSAYFFGSLAINISYDVIKELMKTFGGDIGVTNCPTSEAHCWIRMWSLLGAGDGYGDRGESTPDNPHREMRALHSCAIHTMPPLTDKGFIRYLHTKQLLGVITWCIRNLDLIRYLPIQLRFLETTNLR